MDPDGIEDLNVVRLAVYRAALKLRSLQKLCQMHLVTLQDLHPVLRAVGGLGDPTVSLSQQNLRQSLELLFRNVLRELHDEAIQEATEQTTRLLFKLYDRDETGVVLLRSVEAALVVLSGDTLSAKHRALFQLAVGCSGRLGTERSSVSHNGLRVILKDLSQIPAVVQENHVFGQVETAAHSCFNGMINVSIGEEQFLSWLQSEPRLLLWLSTLFRISVSEAVLHRVRCHVCKAFPITGLRYRCLKCLNVHLCQTCFLTETRTRKHKSSHPVLEYCTQPSWKESMASLASSARHALLPRRYTRRDTGWRTSLRPESSFDPQQSSNVPMQQQSTDDPGSFPPPPPPPPDTLPVQKKLDSKSLQTDEPATKPERKTSFLLKDLRITQKAMKDLQRDKWLLEREFQVWKVAAKSEHDSLEDRCADLEATMEALSHHNQQLEEELQRIQLALSRRDKDEFGSGNQQISPSPPMQQHHKYDTTEKHWTASESSDSLSGSFSEEGGPEQREEEEKEERMGQNEEEQDEILYQVREEAHMDLAVLDNPVALAHAVQEVKLVEEPEQEALEEEEQEMEEEEPQLQREELDTEDPSPDVSAQEDSGTDISDEKDQKEPQLQREELDTEDPSPDVSAQEDSGTDNSDEKDEEELCNLVQRLKSMLHLSPPTRSGAHQKDALIQAAEAVGDSVSHLVTSVRSLT